MFKASRNWPHYSQETRFFSKETGRHYTKDEDGNLVETKNPLTDPDYKPIDYSADSAEIDLSTLGDYA